jgi:cytochrome c oxidase subunit 2
MLIAAISLWISHNHTLLPVAASQQAPLVDRFFNIMFTIAIALFIVVEGTILIFLVKYRRRQGDNTDGVPVEGNIALEIFWTAIPTIIVIALGIYSVDIYNQMGGLEPAAHLHSPVAHVVSSSTLAAEELKSTTAPSYGFNGSPQNQSKPADVVVDVQGMQFAWLFNYPDSGVSAGELHIPVGADVQLNLSATDVIHSFWVPQFRLKQDAIPGISTKLRFVATKPGTYPIVCTELCGGYHGSMRSEVVVQTPEEYQSWLTENQLAQKQHQVVAINPANLSPSEFLAPYVHAMGIGDSEF